MFFSFIQTWARQGLGPTRVTTYPPTDLPTYPPSNIYIYIYIYICTI